MCEDYSKVMVEDFLKSSMSTVKVLVNKLSTFKKEEHDQAGGTFPLRKWQKVSVQFTGNQFFLRGSVEYTNPQLTVEEVQGIVGTRLLEASANYFDKVGLHQPERRRRCPAL